MTENLFNKMIGFLTYSHNSSQNFCKRYSFNCDLKVDLGYHYLGSRGLDKESWIDFYPRKLDHMTVLDFQICYRHFTRGVKSYQTLIRRYTPTEKVKVEYHDSVISIQELFNQILNKQHKENPKLDYFEDIETSFIEILNNMIVDII